MMSALPASAPPPLRVAFVGQGLYFRLCALEAPAAGLQPTFLDFRSGVPPGPLLGRLRELDPDVIVVFRPEIVPHGLFETLRAVTVGFLTEPLPRDPRSRDPDLAQRRWWLERVDPGNFDRIVSFDPLIAETAARVVPVWRSLPLPVADSLFAEVRERRRPPRLLFLGRSTPHRERLLDPIKRRHPIVHIGHGLAGEALVRVLRRTDIQLNLHNNPYPTFENRVSIALAAGHLVISEPLSPRHDLRPATDFLEASEPDEFASLVDEFVRDAGAHVDVQHAGRAAAERFRASAVYPSLLRDAVSDVAEHGCGGRRRTASAGSGTH